MADQSIGMMEGAFFVSKGEILSWVNNLLKLNLSKVEQLGTGAAYCQIIDSLYPGKVKMTRVNWKARNEWEFLINLKILQQAFQKCNIQKHIEIEKLAKAKYQDNLEFAQWMKRFFDIQGGAQEEYDSVKRRGGQENIDTEMDFSFVELRDNSRLHSMRKERNDGSSDNKVYASKKLISRSKSPIIKSLEKNPQLLYSKSREIQMNNKIRNSKVFTDDIQLLVEKIKEIESVVNQTNLKDDQKLLNIKMVIQQANLIPVMRQYRHSVSQHIQPQLQNVNASQQLQEQSEDGVILEENESPRISKIKKRDSINSSAMNNSNSQSQQHKKRISSNDNKLINSELLNKSEQQGKKEVPKAREGRKK